MGHFWTSGKVGYLYRWGLERVTLLSKSTQGMETAGIGDKNVSDMTYAIMPTFEQCTLATIQNI